MDALHSRQIMQAFVLAAGCWLALDITCMTLCYFSGLSAAAHEHCAGTQLVVMIMDMAAVGAPLPVNKSVVEQTRH